MAPSRSTMRRSPTGESVTVHMSVVSFRCGGSQRLPQVQLGVGAPRPPGLGELTGARRVAVETPQRVADADVGGQEDVGVAEGAQGDVVGGPRPDTRDVEEPPAYVVAVGTAVEPHLAVGERPAQGDQGPAP